jgi:hypothetical protein
VVLTAQYVAGSAITNRIAVSRFHAASLSRGKDDAPKAETPYDSIYT